jgi:hypothetical protein
MLTPRSISFDKFTKPDPLFREVAEEIKVDVTACFPKYLEHCIMWIDPNAVIVKTTWSYSSKNTEEILFPKTKALSQFANPYSPQPSPVKASPAISKLALPDGTVHKSNLNKAEALLWKQFCGQQLDSDNNVEPNRIFA